MDQLDHKFLAFHSAVLIICGVILAVLLCGCSHVQIKVSAGEDGVFKEIFDKAMLSEQKPRLTVPLSQR